MGNGINTKTQRLTREQVAGIVGDNSRAIKVFENLTQDVADTLPDAIAQIEQAAQYSLQAATSSRAVAATARQKGDDLEVMLMLTRTQATQIAALRRDVDELRSLAQGV